MAREALVKNRTAAKNRARTPTLAILKRHSAEQLRQIKRQMSAIETEIMAIIKADPYLAGRFAILVSIPGVSAITAFALLIDMPALVAMRFDPDLKAKYNQLKAAGKASKVAESGSMRRSPPPQNRVARD